MILIFESTAAAEAAERQLKKWGLKAQPLSDCPALAFSTQDTGLCVKALAVAGITWVLPAAGE